jgi:hypothetical protein
MKLTRIFTIAAAAALFVGIENPSAQDEHSLG